MGKTGIEVGVEPGVGVVAIVLVGLVGIVTVAITVGRSLGPADGLRGAFGLEERWVELAPKSCRSRLNLF